MVRRSLLWLPGFLRQKRRNKPVSAIATALITYPLTTHHPHLPSSMRRFQTFSAVPGIHDPLPSGVRIIPRVSLPRVSLWGHARVGNAARSLSRLLHHVGHPHRPPALPAPQHRKFTVHAPTHYAPSLHSPNCPLVFDRIISLPSLHPAHSPSLLFPSEHSSRVWEA